MNTSFNNYTNVHLVLIRLSAMGDVAMSVHVILAFREKYPKAKITVVTKKLFQPIFEQISNTCIIVWDTKIKHKGFLGILKIYQEIKKIKPTHFADLHQVLRSKTLTLLLSLNKTILCKSIDKGRKEKKALTHWERKTFKPLKTSHQRYLEVLIDLGFTNIQLKAKNILTPLCLSLNSKKCINYNSSKTYIGIAPFAQHESKVYPIEQLKKVIIELNKNDNYQILLFGGGSYEKQQLDTICKTLKNTHNLVGKLNFREELEVISQLKLMISMDSGNGHLAAMYGVPVISIWGLTHPYAGFAPYMQISENNILPDLEKFPKIPTSVYGNKYPKGYLEAFNTINYKDIIKRSSEVINE